MGRFQKPGISSMGWITAPISGWLAKDNGRALCFHLCTTSTSIYSVRKYLSWENEQRCRGLLEKSTVRYKKETMGAAVLVSLCSVAGDPAILYTLRSSTLTGLYKGQV
ncbi:hypothetical protein E2320_020693, partial [Naja naja]